MAAKPKGEFEDATPKSPTGPADRAAGEGGAPGDTLAVAAAMPVHVRRSRVPVLSVEARRAGAAPAATAAGAASDASATPRRRLPPVALVVVLLVIVVVLAYLVYRLVL